MASGPQRRAFLWFVCVVVLQCNTVVSNALRCSTLVVLFATTVVCVVVLFVAWNVWVCLCRDVLIFSLY